MPLQVLFIALPGFAIFCLMLYAIVCVVSIRAKMDVIALELKGIRELLKR